MLSVEDFVHWVLELSHDCDSSGFQGIQHPNDSVVRSIDKCLLGETCSVLTAKIVLRHDLVVEVVLPYLPGQSDFGCVTSPSWKVGDLRSMSLLGCALPSPCVGDQVLRVSEEQLRRVRVLVP